MGNPRQALTCCQPHNVVKLTMLPCTEEDGGSSDYLSGSDSSFGSPVESPGVSSWAWDPIN